MGFIETKETSLRPPSNTSIDESTNSIEKNEPTMVAEPIRAPSTEDHNEKSVSGDGLKGEIQDTVEEAKEQDSADNEPEDESNYPVGWKLALITIALCLSVFCMALDNTIIAVAIPKITDTFNSVDNIGWYGSAYLLTTCAFQLMFGKLYSFYSIKWVYLIALFIFEVGSLICAVAPTSATLVVGRAIAGLGSAGIFSGAILCIAHTVPLRQRPTYTGFIGAMYGIASVAGPLMGGAFTDNPHLTWRWCFYINLPFGAVTAIFIFFFFTSPKREKAAKMSWKAKLGQMDLLGTMFFLPGIICLLLALQWGGAKYAWGNWRIIILFIFFALCISAFIAIQLWKKEAATVPPRIFKQRSVWSSAWFGAFLGGAFFVLVYYLPIWFQAIKESSAVKSGIQSLPLILGLVIVSVVAGGLVTVLGYYTPFMLASTVFMAVGAGLLTTFEPNTGHPIWIGYQFMFGLGVGLGMQQTLIAVQTAIPLVDVPIGTATVMFAQTLGGALFISVAQNVFQNQLIKNIASQIPEVPNIAGIVASTGATELKGVITKQFPDQVARVIQAYNDALTETFYVSVAAAALTIVGSLAVEWKSVKGKPAAPAAAAV